MPSLSQDLRHSLEAPITQKEIVAAITPMQSGKYPGPEGLPSDFFKKFSDSFDSGKLPPSFYQACISLLLKKDKDPLDQGYSTKIQIGPVRENVLTQRSGTS